MTDAVRVQVQKVERMSVGAQGAPAWTVTFDVSAEGGGEAIMAVRVVGSREWDLSTVEAAAQKELRRIAAGL